MNAKRSVTIALVFALLAAALLTFLPETTSAAPEPGPLESAIQQPPPPPPPPPPTTNNPGGSGSGQAPPAPSTAPTAAEPLPDPQAEPAARSAAQPGVKGVAISELDVLVDRGCPSQYNLGDPIEFISRRGQSTAAGYWMYMEIWNSTNQAWWSKLAADWVEPGGSISRGGRIAEPVGQEQLFSRLIDQYGNIIEEAWCDYQSVSTPQYDQISCNQTIVRMLSLNEEHKYSFNGPGGREIRVSMQGTGGLDTYLELHAPNGSLVASNDDVNAPYDLNSRMQVRLPSSGTYTIVARGFKYQAGEYTLSVFCN